MKSKLIIGVVIAGLAAVLVFMRAAPEPTGAPAVATPEFTLEPPATFVTDVDVSEDTGSAVGKALKGKLLVAVRERDWAAAQAFLTEDFVGRFAAADTLALVGAGAGATDKRSTGATDEGSAGATDEGSAGATDTRGAGAGATGDDGGGSGIELRTVGQGPAVDGAGFVAALKTYFDGLAAVERASFSFYRFLLDPDLEQAFGEGHLSISGVAPDGRRHSWVGSVRIWARRSMPSAKEWKLRGIDVVSASWSAVARPAFVDIAPSTGFGFVDSAEDAATAKALINMRRLFSSGGITVLDWRDDGWWDVLATREGRGATLFVNDGRGGFTPTSIDALGPRSQAAKFHLWIDLDGDGAEELVTTRVDRTKRGVQLGLYSKGRRGELQRVRGALKFDAPKWLREMDFEGIVTCDVDGDQRLDLFVLGYMHADSAGESFNLVDGRDGLRNLLFINRGGLKFEEVALQRGLTDTRYSYVSECFDFDGDGDADIFVGNDYGNNDYYENLGQGRFRADAAHPFHVSRGFTMGFSMADYDNTGRWSVSLSNMYSHAGNRIVPLAQKLSDEMRDQVHALAAGNDLFELDDGEWTNTSKDKGVDYAHWAWGNIFFDLDNDADKDLFVVNGFTSHTDASAPDW